MKTNFWILMALLAIAMTVGCGTSEHYRGGIIFRNAHPEEKILTRTIVSTNLFRTPAEQQVAVSRGLSEFLEEGTRNVIEVVTYYRDGYLWQAVVSWTVYPEGEGKNLRFKFLTHKFQHDQMLERGLETVDATVKKDMENSPARINIPIKYKGYRVAAEAWSY